MTREQGPARASDVLSAVGDTASQLSSFFSTMLEEQPAVVLAAAASAGFVMGGGLASRIGTRITTSTVRATLGNVATLMALDLLQRALQDGGVPSGSSPSTSPGIGPE